MPTIAKYVEAETGEEIIVFIRRGRPITMVRDAVTKRFIRGIRGIQVAVSLVFDYPPTKARHSNPLYIDVKTASYVTGADLAKLDEVEKQLAEKGRSILNRYFGEYLEKLAEQQPPERYDGRPPEDKMPKRTCVGGEVGVEYIAVPIDDVYPDYHYWVIWHHYRDDCKEDEGSGTI